MWHYLIGITGFVLLCVFWGVFQLWLRRVDQDDSMERDRCHGCGGCGEEDRSSDK